jgi:protocatechuate 4,5-dioxygenase beta chain
VGTGETHTLPGERQAKFLKLKSKQMKGHPAFAEYLIRFADSASFPLAFSDALEFVDDFSVPAHFLGIHESRFVPIFTNCLHRNRPSPRTFLAFGRLIADAVAKCPQDLRVAVLATGGLSHDPYGPRWGLVDEAFDRRFLSLLEAGQTNALLEEFTLEKILEPGRGGTPEMLNWFVALGAAGFEARAEILGYRAIPEWSTGMGYVDWPIKKNPTPKREQVSAV